MIKLLRQQVVAIEIAARCYDRHPALAVDLNWVHTIGRLGAYPAIGLRLKVTQK